MLTPIPNKALKTAIYTSGMNQRQFSFSMGVSETLVSNIINGFKKPSKNFKKESTVLLNRNEHELFPE